MARKLRHVQLGSSMKLQGVFFTDVASRRLELNEQDLGGRESRSEKEIAGATDVSQHC